MHGNSYGGGGDVFPGHPEQRLRRSKRSRKEFWGHSKMPRDGCARVRSFASIFGILFGIGQIEFVARFMVLCAVDLGHGSCSAHQKHSKSITDQRWICATTG